MANNQWRGALWAISLATVLVACESPADPVASPRASKKPAASPKASGTPKTSGTPKASVSASPRPSPSGSPAPSTKPTGTPTPTPAPTGSAFTISATPTPLPTPAGPVVLTGAATTVVGPTSQYPDAAPENVKIAVPGGLAIDPAGKVYVADQQNHRIRVVDEALGTVRTYAGGGDATSAAGSADGPIASARFRLPVDVARARSGVLYVADGGNAAIRAIDAAGKAVSTVVADSSTSAETPKTGPLRRMVLDPATDTLYVAGASALFKVEPLRAPVKITKLADAIADGLALDPRGALVFVNREAHTVRRLDLVAAGAVPTLVAGSGARGKADGPGAAASFDSPEGVAVDRDGVVYVADTGNNLLRRIALTGVVDTLASTLVEPLAIAIGPTGFLYVSEGSGAVRLVK